MARERRIVGETEISLSALRYPTSFERNKTGVTRARPQLRVSSSSSFGHFLSLFQSPLLLIITFPLPLPLIFQVFREENSIHIEWVFRKERKGSMMIGRTT